MYIFPLLSYWYYYRVLDKVFIHSFIHSKTIGNIWQLSWNIIGWHVIMSTLINMQFFSGEFSHIFLWQKYPLHAFSFKSKKKIFCAWISARAWLARITARASRNNETDKSDIVTNALKEQICSEFETKWI